MWGLSNLCQISSDGSGTEFQLYSFDDARDGWIKPLAPTQPIYLWLLDVVGVLAVKLRMQSSLQVPAEARTSAAIFYQ